MDISLKIHPLRNLHLALIVNVGENRRKTALLFISCMLATGFAQAGGNEKLTDIHETIKHKYEKLQHVKASELETIADNDLIIFDVRRQSEFDVSHLAGAVRVAPDISTDNFMASYRDIVNGKTLVFYCSVGQRSSALANRIQNELVNAGTTEIYNLEGGIFRWHNDSRALVSGQQASDFVHPYNDYLGRLIDRAELIRYYTKD